MLQMTTIVSAEGAKSYFRVALSRGEYSADEKILDQEGVGGSGSLAAERLGLSYRVTTDAYESLCDNRTPKTSDQLTRQTNNLRSTLASGMPPCSIAFTRTATGPRSPTRCCCGRA